MRRNLLTNVLALLLAGAGVARADVVLDWNAIATQAALTGGRPGPTPMLDLAIISAAMHDAVQAYEKRFEPYAVNIENAGGSMIAAVAKTSRDVVVNRFPAKTTEINN